jgi:hypothetical protein
MGWILEINVGKVLFFVFWKIRREYIAPNTVAEVIIIKDLIFHFITELIISNSPINFGVGGSPRLVTHVIIHQSERRGAINLNPRVIANVRVLFRSYSKFARQNSLEDISPCAIIKVVAPLIPQGDKVNTPAATILICPTEE